MRKIIDGIINSNIYISLAAVALTIETQIQLGLKPQWHPYLFIIFFATLFEYNLHRLITVLTNKEALNSEKHRWVNENLAGFYVLVAASVVGFAVVAVLAKKEVLITFAPIALVTLFYSLPIPVHSRPWFRLREIPYLKIFLIAMVWSASTILLPIVQFSGIFDNTHVALLLTERFFFLFAIAIPFDLRDFDADRREGLKTFARFGEKKAMAMSYTALILFFMISVFHFLSRAEIFITFALGLSAICTFISFWSPKIRKLPHYHYGILDGAMLLQGAMVLAFYYLNGN